MTTDERNALVMSWTGLAWYMARWAAHGHPEFDVHDLAQEGHVALLEAADKHAGGSGDFKVCAQKAIRKRIRAYVAADRAVWLPRRSRRRSRRPVAIERLEEPFLDKNAADSSLVISLIEDYPWEMRVSGWTSSDFLGLTA